MTSDQILLVRSSWPTIAASSDELAVRFYECLFEIDSSAARLFVGVDMIAQRQKLSRSLAVIVHALDDLDTLLPTMAALGKRHTTYGVEHRHFDSVRDALLSALALTLADAFTAELRNAWADAYMLAASVMRRALVRARSSSGGTTGEFAIDRG